MPDATDQPTLMREHRRLLQGRNADDAVSRGLSMNSWSTCCAVITAGEFGRIEIARQFILRANNMDTDSLDAARADCTVSLICIDPGTFEKLDLSKREHSDRVWNLCVEAYQSAGNMRTTLDGFMQDFEKDLD